MIYEKNVERKSIVRDDLLQLIVQLTQYKVIIVWCSDENNRVEANSKRILRMYRTVYRAYAIG